MKCTAMRTQQLPSSLFSFFFFAVFFSFACLASAGPVEEFIHCLTRSSNSISNVIYTPANPSYFPILQFNLNNPIFNLSSTPRPSVIVTPRDETHVRAVVLCARSNGLRMRTRCGGHDFEALSYVAPDPFVMLEMINMRAVDVDVPSKTAWVQGGATLGEFYYGISQKSNTLGFPAGVWSNVGVSGLISGGGYGNLMRKYGLAGDNVLDAHFVDFNGRILDRKSMGEDLFWAIRGGGASSFGVILAWKVQLVDVPAVMTAFAVNYTLEQNVTSVFHQWQTAAPTIDRDLHIRVVLQSQLIGNTGRKTLQFSFQGAFQGGIDRVVPIVNNWFPALGLRKEDCAEMSWIQTALVFSGFSATTPPKILLDRSAVPKFPAKCKSDYITEPIPIDGLEGQWKKLLEADVGTVDYVLNPLGGRMDDIPESAIPFPHRRGVLYQMLQSVILDVQNPGVTRRRIEWIRSYYAYMRAFVSKNPRQAYVNYNDLDLGVGEKTFKEANIWGRKYFKNNFPRLVQVKSKVDPGNFFRHPQSIPPLQSFY